MRWTVGFAAWTLFVWVGRVRNIAADDSLGGFEVVWRLGLALAFCVLAVAVLAAQWRESRVNSAWLGHIVRLLAAFTVVVWLIRGGGILIDGSHAAGFKVVHTALAAISIGLAWRADREASRSGSKGFGPLSASSVS